MCFLTLFAFFCYPSLLEEKSHLFFYLLELVHYRKDGNFGLAEECTSFVG